MSSPTGVEGASVDRASSDNETVGFILHDGVPARTLGTRARKAAMAFGLVAGVALMAMSVRSSPQCEGLGGAQPSDIGLAIGLAERRQAADKKARAIVKLMNEKPEKEVNVLVDRAMKKAGEKALADRREMADQKTFNQILADVSNQCTIESPNSKPGKGGYFLGHDYNGRVYMDPSDGGPQQWRITHAGAPDVYNLQAIVPAKDGDFLAHDGGFKVGLSKTSADERWRINPVPGMEDKDLYVIEAVGAAEGKVFLSRSNKNVEQVGLAGKVGGNQMWKIPCIAPQYERQAQRKAVCAFDVLYATQYVARGSLMIQSAARTCPNSKGLLSKVCAINSLVIVSSFSNLALALSNAASSCAATTNVQALCASGVEELVSALSMIGAGGLITATACKPGATVEDLGLPEGANAANLGGPAYMGRRLFLGGGKSNFMAQCVLDFTQVAWSLGSVALAITAAVRDSCPSSIQGTSILVGISQSACSMDIAAVVYAFGRIAMFLSLAMIHCTEELNLQALCAGGVSALVSSAAALVVSGDAFYIACDQGIKVENSGGTVPLRIGAATEAGLTRRLAAQALADGAKDADVHKMVKDLGYNISTPLKLPTFDNIDSAMRVLESSDQMQAHKFGVDEVSLKKKFKNVEDIWKHVGFDVPDLSNAKGIPRPPALRDESERFVKMMDPVLSEEDKRRVAAAMSPEPSQKWQWPSSKNKCH